MTKKYFNISIYDDLSDELPRAFNGLNKNQLDKFINHFFEEDLQEGMSFHVFVYDVDADDYDDFDDVWDEIGLRDFRTDENGREI